MFYDNLIFFCGVNIYVYNLTDFNKLYLLETYNQSCKNFNFMFGINTNIINNSFILITGFIYVQTNNLR